ncbi:ATP-dependent metalloprotease FtsH [Coriobacterium glomerans PW2]|uniref:ATP-dependent zinc metalloprotease FtsH n=1 Tax=Coriobacterium glomerans (strain ATCC 49209 / DSM 20642 / JCM 10262 / PW2) TaxID=700015 RepID=F2N7P2_CORGP|nr:ATP-dependent zinc metalloprotease FtsH [Coriobacterium glomerans]AEB06934.1 ATP-dependent metalloprotease FtsH [Coriobacterium glomerans PW2]
MEMDDRKRKRTLLMYILLICAVYLIVNVFVLPRVKQQQIKDTDYSQFVDDLNKKNIDSVEYHTDSYEILYKKKGEDDSIAYRTTGVPNDAAFTDRVLKAGASLKSTYNDGSSNAIFSLLLTMILPIGFFALAGWLLNRRMKKSMGDDGPSMNFGGGFGMGGGLGKSGARIIGSKEVGITFKDVAGQEEAKEALKEVVDFLENPKRYEEIGAKLPRGALLVGPPGTGKTLMAKAVAGEAGVPFFSISGSEFVEMFVGRGAAKVRDLFKQANEKAPCIVFIDEIDTIGKRRDGGGISGNDEREQTLNQLLTEMDGFDNHKGIVVIAATNRPDTLDPALLRPGRFDRRIPVELPDLAGRNAILKLHSKDVKTEEPIDLNAVARATPGASGADLANIINEGALRAVRMGRKRATQDDFEESVEVVIAGMERKSTVLSDHEKQVVSYHEIGHAIVAASQKGAAPVTKITIVPRTSGALGYTMQVEDDEKFLTTRQEVLDKLTVYCGGRAAEELIFDEMTTGAANDIEQATKLARNMITRFGMSKEFGMMALGTVQNAYLNQDTSLTCAPGTAERVDEAVQKLLEAAHQRSLQLLRENKFKLHELARYLYKKESITGEEFMNLLSRENPLIPKPKTGSAAESDGAAAESESASQTRA